MRGLVVVGEPTPAAASPATRRDRLRIATVEEIKAAGRMLLNTVGSAELSLRAVAREIGMTPSAIYRYFESRRDLLDALALDAFDSLAEALDACVAEHVDADWLVRGVALCHAYRDWCRAHPAEFVLVFQTPQPVAPDEAHQARLLAFYRQPVVLLAARLEAGEVALPEGMAAASVRPEMVELAQEALAPTADAALVATLLSLWASVHGHVCLELSGHAGFLVGDADAAFEAHVRRTLGTLALPPG